MLGVAQIKKCTNNSQVEIHFANRIRHKTLPFEAAFVIKKKGTGPICRALGYEPNVLKAMEAPKRRARSLDVDGAHNIPVPPTPLRSIEDQMVIGNETANGAKGNGKGLELIGQELMIHRTIQQTVPGSLEGNPNQLTNALAELVTPTRPARTTPGASSMVALEMAEEVGTGGSNFGSQQVMRAPAGLPVSYGPMGSGQGSQEGFPLFTQDQLRRLHDLQQQAPYLYQKRSGKGVGEGAGQTGSVRMEAVQHDLQVLHRHRDQLLEENRLMEEHNNKSREENRRWFEENQRLRAENSALRFRLILTDVQPGQSEHGDHLYQTPDRQPSSVVGGSGEVFELGSVNVTTNVKVTDYDEVQQNEQDLKNNEALKNDGVSKYEEVIDETYVEKSNEGKNYESGRHPGSSGSGGNGGDATLQLLAKMMEGMTNLQQQIMNNKDKEGDSESVRGQQELPPLAPWSAATGPVDLSDWLAVIEPIMADLSATSGSWWTMLVKEASDWYAEHLRLQPLDRVTHDPIPSASLTPARWGRLERRASTMLLSAIPQGLREELVASKRLSALKIVCQLMILYQPGGLGEKELILRQLESPPEASTVADAVQGLRRWFRWKGRASELHVQEPDAFLLLKGLNRLTKKPLEQHRDLSFRISLARSTLQVDSTPTPRSITSFALHLLAEFEQVVHLESHGSRKQPPVPDKLKSLKAKKLEEEGERSDRWQRRRDGDGGEREVPKCRFFLTKEGCRKGKSCGFSHDLKDEVRRCYVCGCPDHFANECPRKNLEKNQSRSPPKVSKAEVQEDAAQREPVEVNGEDKEKGSGSTANPTVQGLLEEATKVLKSISATTSGGVARSGQTEPMSQREEVMANLQQQLDQLKKSSPSARALRLSRMGISSTLGLLDSGATHPLRRLHRDEDRLRLRQVEVTLADGEKKMLYVTPTGVMVTEMEDVEPIVPMGLLTTVLGCSIKWKGENIYVDHPRRGRLDVTYKDGCPMVTKEIAMELIKEIEENKLGASLKGLSFEGEDHWIGSLVQSHPVLRGLPVHIKEALTVKVGSWRDLPLNKRLRKRCQRDGLMVHLYAGDQKGYTLKEALSQRGGPADRLLELDLLRGAGHDLLDEKPFSGLLRAAVDGKLEALVGGPNCRTRSVLRHYPIPDQENYPRPVRAWERDQQYGLEELSEEERRKVQEDDVLLWRMIFLYMVATYFREAQGVQRKVGFVLEHPASPRDYMPECVSIWDQDDWKTVMREFKLDELTLQQGRYGGEAPKPTTFANNLDLEPSTPWNSGVRSARGEGDSKRLARWAPGVMNLIAGALNCHYQGGAASLRALTWDDHLKHNHVPFRRDCKVCQEAQQRQHPHRRCQHPLCGVLSLDTTGPFHLAKDVEGKAKYILVGTLTWLVPHDSPLKEPEDQPLPQEGSPELEELLREIEEEKSQEREGVTEPTDHAPGSVEDATWDMEELESDTLRQEKDQGKEDEATDPVPKLEQDQAQGEVVEEDQPLPEGFSVRVFRMALPMSSKHSSEVTQTAMEFILRLRADGFFISRVHTDGGREFLGQFKQWLASRGILHSRTPGDDPRANGRVEVAVQTIKTMIRRVMIQAGATREWWPWAVRYVNELLRNSRITTPVEFPGFLEVVHTRKRTWKNQQFEAVMSQVMYLCPAWHEHGHFIQRENERPSVTRYVLRRLQEPTTEAHWIALEKEVEDTLSLRRRIRGKSTIRSLEVHHSDQEEELVRQVVEKVIKDEMDHLVMDDLEASMLELPILNKLKKVAMEESTNDEVLQTKVISPKEVASNLEEWESAIEDEIQSLLEDKEALRPVTKKEAEDLMRKQKEKGKTLEVIPSKLVFTRKPAAPPKNYKNKMRWVVCGNYEMKKEHEETYSGGADSAAFRLMMAVSAQNQWCGGSVDIKTAFLNATINYEQEDDLVLIKPPHFLVEKNYVGKDTTYLPLKAVYGFRRSPRLWSQQRDQELEGCEIEIEEGGRKRTLSLTSLQSEPNLWKISEVESGINVNPVLEGLLMTYVDDIFITGGEKVVDTVLSKISSMWATSPAERVSQKPIRFLGMEVSKVWNPSTSSEDWFVNQESFIKELINKNEEVKIRKIPITKDHASLSVPEVLPTAESIRTAQRQVGECLWLVTRSRPDIMFTVSKMGSLMTKDPKKVSEMMDQLLGYLRSTVREGLIFKKNEKEEKVISAYSDASFAPEGECSHGCSIITYNGTPVLWKSSRQPMVTLSTAESELIELVEAMAAGESISVMVEELQEGVVRMAWCDNQSTVAIMSQENGSWRTRHLRIKSSFARAVVLKGQWALQHLRGQEMVADIGTKALSAIRLQYLKDLMCIGSPASQKEDEVEDAKGSEVREKVRI